MKIATIVPSEFLSLTAEDSYFMALAHLVGEDDRYTAFMRRRSDDGRFILMDNGVVEGFQQNLYELLKRARLIRATEIILPDSIADGAETIKKTVQAVQYIEQVGVPSRLMAVPQGKTIEEWTQCAEQLIKLPIDAIGISKFITRDAGKSARLSALGELLSLGWTKDIHLLGCWENPQEVFALYRLCPEIRGVDSAIAYVYAKEGLFIDPAIPRPMNEINFGDTDVDNWLLRANIGRWKSYCLFGKPTPNVAQFAEGAIL